MKSILKTIAAVAAFFMFAFAANAQQMPNPEEAAQRVCNKLASELSLDDSQKEKVTQIYQEHFQEIGKYKTRGANTSEIKESREELHKQMKEVLNDEQFEKYASMEKEREERINQHKEQMKDDMQDATEELEDVDQEEQE
ncbi:hypothetical protein [Sediminitomix flava]|uniref:Uncharacterized protein n=1 Tax=Sediminitomix flava TaxID=379075 RepID=A0A315YW91_SEDFL|nr:hypothetical protein [Sediminitomix flava]PWJ34175.1 hypothetical protein BC781_11185 [Sediminitomix flava]